MTKNKQEGKDNCNEDFSSSLLDVLTNSQETNLRRIVYNDLQHAVADSLGIFLQNILLLTDNMTIAPRSFVVYT